MSISKFNVTRLIDVLKTKRPTGTEYTTAKSILGNIANYVFDERNEFMFAYIDVKNDTSVISTIFTCHLDTVERDTGNNDIQIIDNMISVKNGGILGADDGAGICVLLHMIENKINGRYFFFSKEEIGGVSSKFAVHNHPELFEGVSRAIAFDRKGTSDVVVSQIGQEGCSPLFGLTLSDKLTELMPYEFEPASGVYTDTAEMFNCVPECVNVSVGYYNEHTSRESLDLTYLINLCNAVCVLDWNSLPTVRDCSTLPKNVYNTRYLYDDLDYDLDCYDKMNDVDEILDLMQINGITISDLIKSIKEDKLIHLL
jgi:hypothetical protein